MAGIFSPTIEVSSDWIEQSVEVIGGVPQLLMRLNLKDDPERGITGVAPHTLLYKVIIGPCEYPLQVQAAICDALARAGIIDPISKICMSQIPYRHR